VLFTSFPPGALRDVRTGHRLGKLPRVEDIDEPYIDGSVSHDGRRLVFFVAGSGAEPMRILDTRTGDLVAELRGLAAPTRAAFSGDDALVVTAGSDSRVWDAASGTLLLTVHTRDRGFMGATFDDRAATIVTWTSPGVCAPLERADVATRVTVVDAHHARITRALTPAERQRYHL
jgi:WD40 repeat protein